MNFGGQAVLVNGHRVSAEVVALLGLNGPLHPDAGRAFIPSEFAPDSEPVVAISHRLWQAQYASADSILGQTITADGKALRVVAVLSRKFDFFPDSDLLVPLTFSEPGSYSEYARRLEVYGSLRPGLTPDLAALMLTTATRYFSPTQVATVESVRERVFRGFRPTVKILSVVSLIILVVGCLNFATLLTVRSADRQPELAVRIALGRGPATDRPPTRHRSTRIVLRWRGRRRYCSHISVAGFSPGTPSRECLHCRGTLSGGSLHSRRCLRSRRACCSASDRPVERPRVSTSSPRCATRCLRRCTGLRRLVESARTGSSDRSRSH